MRIIAGKFKATHLVAPDGKDTRPTADRARESLFNILEHGKYSRRLRGARVVDVFAGTGALGLEALSRGAAFASFFERDSKALNALQTNIKKCKMEDASKIYRTDALSPPTPDNSYDILFFDPPYYQDFASQSVAAFLKADWMEDDGLSVIQVHPDDIFTPPSGYEIIDTRKYGAAHFSFLVKSS